MANKENLANGILAADITDTDTQITLDSGSGASDMPSAPFYATITLIGVVSNKSNSEIVYVTAVTDNTLTVVRGQRGTVAKSFPSGSIVANGFYVEDLEGFVESDTTDRLTVSDTEPENPSEGDVWIDTNELPEELAPTSIVWKERPAGDVDGVNRAFQTNQPYISGSLQVFINGIAQSQLVDESGAGSGVFELDTAPLIGDDITVQYQIRTVATGNADTVDGYHASATPAPNNILVLDGEGKIPSALLPDDIDVENYASSNFSLNSRSYVSTGLSVDVTTTKPNQRVDVFIEGRSTGASTGAGNVAYTYAMAGANALSAGDSNGMIATAIAGQSMHMSVSIPVTIPSPGTTNISLWVRCYGGTSSMTITDRRVKVVSR